MVTPSFQIFVMWHPVALEVHHIDIVGLRRFTGRRHRATVPAVRAAKNPEGRHVVAVLVDGERPTSAAPSGRIDIRPFIHSVYASRVVTSARASVCAAKVAPGWQ